MARLWSGSDTTIRYCDGGTYCESLRKAEEGGDRPVFAYVTHNPGGAQVATTGSSLNQTLGVGFGNRVPAPFTVNSDTQVTATVPTDRKTGKIGIQTEGGTAISSGILHGQAIVPDFALGE